MDAGLLVIIVIAALMVLHDAHRQGGGMHDWIPVAIGAAVGSTLAAWWRKAIRWVFQLISGAWFGASSGHYLIYLMQWPSTDDFLLLAGSIMGLIGFSIVDGLTRIEFGKLIPRLAALLAKSKARE